MKKRFLWLMLPLVLPLPACQHPKVATKQNNTINTTSNEKQIGRLNLSNMSSDKSLEQVKTALSQQLAPDNVNQFIECVKDYNDTVEKVSLVGDFAKRKPPHYDMAKIDQLWAAKKGDFIGTNCRINTFMLLKDKLTIQDINSDDSLLFSDKDAIRAANLFTEEETNRFKQLFSKVTTEPTKDISVHAKKMQAHLSHVSFNSPAKMVSVVLHDNLDGDALFIGHVGVLVEHAGGYLFVEKLSFQDPFQAILFDTKEDCYRYLFNTYKKYQDSTTAAPFIMENDQFVSPKRYKS